MKAKQFIEILRKLLPRLGMPHEISFESCWKCKNKIVTPNYIHLKASVCPHCKEVVQCGVVGPPGYTSYPEGKNTCRDKT